MNIKTILVLVTGIMILLYSSYEGISSQYRQDEAIDSSARSFEKLLVSEDIASSIAQVGRAARLYIIEHDAKTLSRYREMQSVLTQKFHHLHDITRDDAVQRGQVVASYVAYRAHNTRMNAILTEAVGSQSGNISTETLYMTVRATQNVLAALSRFNEHERTTLSQTQRTLSQAQRSAMLYMVLSLLVGIIILGVCTILSIAAINMLSRKTDVEERERHNEKLQSSERHATEQSRLLTALNTASASLASEHDLSVIVQNVVDYGLSISGAEFAAFFFVMEEAGQKLLHLEALAGLPRTAFPESGILRATDLFANHTTDILLSDDITLHPDYGGNNPHAGVPSNHPEVKSYIGIPIISTANVHIGVLLFGHREANRFSPMHQQSLKGLAGITSIVIENAHLYSAAQAELEERKRYEDELISSARRQNLLLRELNHRVKNTLVTVQSIAMQTKNAAISKLNLIKHPERLDNLERFYGAFESRLRALSVTHDLLVDGAWEDVSFRHALVAALEPLVDLDRVDIEGPDMSLSPNTAVTLNMVFHELSTNAIKYGSFSVPSGRIAITWCVNNRRLFFTWKERHGPRVDVPDREGFGSKLFDRAITREMRGQSHIKFDQDGIECQFDVPLSDNIRYTNASMAEGLIDV